MPEGQLTGARIRERRLDRAISQTDLAQMAGISSSYLNLIEHNRRRIGGKVLNNIARALALDPHVLTEVAEPALLEALELAAVAEPASGAEHARAREFADRYPGWAATVAAQARRIAALEDHIAALTDRLAHDQHLDTSLHEVISVVTSIRSTASILVGADAPDPDWQDRFHQNIHQDSLRLTEASQALASYLEAPKGGGTANASPADAVERFLDQTRHHIAALEGGLAASEAISAGSVSSGSVLSGPLPAGTEPAGRMPSNTVSSDQTDTVISGIVAGFEMPQSRTLARQWLLDYRADAVAVPMLLLTDAVARLGYDPGILAAALGVPVTTVMRRLAALPAGDGHPPIGIAICDAAGGLVHLKTLRLFALPRNGPACPLWPLYQALTRPGQPIKSVVALPGAAAPRLTCYALAHADSPTSFTAPTPVRSTMLVVADAPTEAGAPVGRTCQVCPRAGCAARREPSILSDPGSNLANLAPA